MEKENVKRFIIAVFAGMATIVLAVYLVDPFYHYHEPWFGMETYLYNTVYQTAGAARNLSYDSAVLGTSMTENFHTSWFDEELDWQTVKLSYSGAKTDDIAAILAQVYESGNEVKNIFMDINDYQLTGNYTEAFAQRPDYLYDKNIFNDVEYVLNKDVLAAAGGRVLAGLTRTAGNMDTAYTWEAPELFGIDKVRKIYEETEKSETAETVKEPFADEANYLEMCRKNMENILPFIEEHKETDFYIFYPPYSLLYWQGIRNDGKLQTMISVYKLSVELLLEYDNVHLFYFQNEREIISDLRNYRDYCHHTPEINRYIFECVKDGKNRMDKNNYEELLTGMYELAKNYDYTVLWPE